LESELTPELSQQNLASLITAAAPLQKTKYFKLIKPQQLRNKKLARTLHLKKDDSKTPAAGSTLLQEANTILTTDIDDSVYCKNLFHKKTTTTGSHQSDDIRDEIDKNDLTNDQSFLSMQSINDTTKNNDTISFLCQSNVDLSIDMSSKNYSVIKAKGHAGVAQELRMKSFMAEHSKDEFMDSIEYIYNN
jgi:hypothetical protein